MEGIHSVQRSRSLLLWLAPLVIVALVVSVQGWNGLRHSAATRAEAESLLTRLDTDAGVTTEEYGVWKQLAAADPKVRLEAVKLFGAARYAPVLRGSQELIGRTVVGADTDGGVSSALAEELICAPLTNAPATANDDVPLYLVPWLNPAALDSESCARILSARLLAADPGTFGEGAKLLALVLAALPPERARPFIDALVARVSVAEPGAVDVLFSALRHVRSVDFPAEFTTALTTLTARISTVQSSTDIAGLFDAVDFLKYSVAATELAPVLDTALGQMLARNDDSLTRALYFTLTDLKTTHPDTSFGRRADYLMRGINIYSDALEIYDYSRVLALDERYAGDDARLARELLGGIRSLDAANYVSRILPYCRRFLESSFALPYADFLAGAQLLVAQLHDDRFIFQRPCLLDSGLVERIAPADRGAVAASVIDALAGMDGPGASNRIAEGIELVGLLRGELEPAQMQRLAAIITRAGGTETDPWAQAKIVRAAVAAAAAANLAFPPEFYSELFVLVVNTVDAEGRMFAPAELLEKLPASQRAYVVDTALAALAAMAAQREDPAALAAQGQLLLALKPWLSATELDQVAATLAAVLEDARSIPLYSRLAGTLVAFRRPLATQQAAVHAAWLKHVAVSEERAQLAELFESAGALGAIVAADAAGRSAVRAAAVRFLEQLVPNDADAGTVRAILAKPPAPPAPLAANGPQRVRGALQRALRNPRVALEAADIERLAARYIRALVEERVSRPITDYALSLGTLAQNSAPGQLDELLRALHQRLDASSDPASHEVLVSAWIAVEKATNAARPPEQRIALYQEILRLPLTNTASRALLIAEAGGIAEQDFGGDVWKVLAWAAAPGALPLVD